MLLLFLDDNIAGFSFIKNPAKKNISAVVAGGGKFKWKGQLIIEAIGAGPSSLRSNSKGKAGFDHHTLVYHP